MAEFKIEFINPADVQRVEADSWTLDQGTWFDFFQDRGEDEVIVMTVNASDVRAITRYEVPRPA